MLHKETSDQILKCYYKVYNKLGHGFLEKVYENALLIEFRRLGLSSRTMSLLRLRPLKV